ncbi:MAG: hypothetical protein A2Y80_02410 [Deltaproteobacteria bacterium RBG_13_58_19]|nr:MAG: hypothetical protein A2Y80_02410 [Deltaproteobacteria bacterium RBG_13_58_19]
MDTIDPQGKIMPLVPQDQTMITRKVEDKEGHGNSPKYLGRPRTPPPAPPDEDEEEKPDDKHLIDIKV